MDHWRPWRLGITDIHEKGRGKADVMELWKKANDRQRDTYQSACRGYTKFWGRKSIVASRANTAGQNIWTEGELRIRIAPDLVMRIGNNDDCLVLLHLNRSQRLTQRLVNPLLAMMQEQLQSNVGVLDVHRGKLFVPTRPDRRRLLLQVSSDAAAFYEIWRQL